MYDEDLMSDTDTESSEEHSSSECSTDSSDDDKLEVVQLNRTRVLLPQGLCEKRDIFNEFITRSWNTLSEVHQQHLRRFLPKFDENEEREQNITLQRLFNGDSFKFSSPLDNFYEHLKAGHYRPDIAKMRYLIRRAERKEGVWRQRKLKERLQVEVAESRKHLLRQMSQLPPGCEPQTQKSPVNRAKSQHPLYNRTKRRYFEILSSIKAKVEENGFSSDDNYPEGPPTPVSRKDKRLLNTIKNSQALNGDKIVVSTLSTKPVGLDFERNIDVTCNPYIITESLYRSLLHEHRKRKFQNLENSGDVSSVSISDIIQRARVNYNKREKMMRSDTVHRPARKKIKKEVFDTNYVSELNISSESDSDSIANEPNAIPSFSSLLASTSVKPRADIRKKVSCVTKHEAGLSPKSVPRMPTPTPPSTVTTTPMTVTSTTSTCVEPAKPAVSTIASMCATLNDSLEPTIKLEQVKCEEPLPSEFMTPATLSDLDGIDMLKLPIDLHDSSIDIMEISTKVELMQDTHSNFLALVRDIICSTSEHRMDMATLEERLKSWQENPITPLNDWYCLADNWLLDLQSAINFLSGNFPEQPDEFVPYIEFKQTMNKYQWIGAGRDSDTQLAPLFQYWLEHKSEMKPVISIKEKDGDKDDIDLELNRSLTPPPPRCPTDWQVRKADVDEVLLFRDQERQRYDNPHKSFTYRCNGYESVVGPLKGIYSPSSGNTKARGHTMLSADRPNFVTILSLVRDATARLPNGEGTRSEICELLRCSQYISNTAPDNVLQSVVSGALDRMHTQFDPCVKYDPKRKIWIYLHRNRSEEDFERIHQQCQGMTRMAKKKKSPTKSKSKVEKRQATVNNSNANPNANNIVVASTTADARIADKAQERPVTKQTSLLINQNITHNFQSANAIQMKTLTDQGNKLSEASDTARRCTSKEHLTVDSEIDQALQAITQQTAAPVVLSQQPATHQTATSTVPSNNQVHQVVQMVQQQPTTILQSKGGHKQQSGKSLVKIIASGQTGGKSLIIPSSTNAYAKQDGRNVIATTKINQPLVTQQLLQTLAHQKQLNLQQQLIRLEMPDSKEKKNLSIPQQILQSISPQQLQNIKNVTLMRNVRQNQGSIMLTHNTEDSSSVHLEKADAKDGVTQQQLQQPIRVQPGTLTLSQQKHLIQTIRQHQGVSQISGQQPLLIRHKGTPVLQKAVVPGASLLGQSRLVQDGMAVGKNSSNPSPIVAKVLTNAAGQVISVESLLAHQKQHGNLSTGTTLRVSGVKGGANIIQLGSPTSNKTSQGSITQVVGCQNNFIAISNQAKLVLSSTTTTNATTTVTASKPIAKAITKTQTLTKFPPKNATQQIINAKFITQNSDGPKIVQPKTVIGQNQIKMPSKANKPVSIQSSTSNTNLIRMINAANLNIAHLGGKPVLLASKATNLQNVQAQNMIIQSQANTSGGILTMPANKANSNAVSTVNLINQSGQQVVLAPQQLKVQPQVLLSPSVKNASLAQSQATTNQIVSGSHPLRLASSSAANAQRVVLASQGQSGQLVAQQILLPAGFQGTAINIKSLQGVKVIPIAQQAKGFQGRQVFARVVSPSTIVRTAAADVKQATSSSE